MLILLFSPIPILICLTISYNWYDIIYAIKSSTSDDIYYNSLPGNNTSMVTKPEAKNTSYNSYNVGRSEPPKACYFGHLDGKDFNVEGPYEPEYLSWSENYDWEKRIKEKLEVSTQSDNENDLFDLPEFD